MGFSPVVKDTADLEFSVALCVVCHAGALVLRPLDLGDTELEAVNGNRSSSWNGNNHLKTCSSRRFQSATDIL
uniref:Uncharacterized protein n=1 Tax=Arundo donax TaxID=35708 RepID=A0A0A8YH33_ARUDO